MLKKNQEERRKVPLSLQAIPACLELTVSTQRKDRCTIFSSLMWKSLIQPMITAYVGKNYNKPQS